MSTWGSSDRSSLEGQPVTAPQAPLRLLICAAARLFGESLAACLNRDDGVGAVLVVHDAVELAGTARDFAADVVLIDVTPRHQLRTARLISDGLPGTPIVALAVSPVADEVIACADAGFVGYVSRDATLAELVEIIRMAVRGETECDPKIARSLVDELRRRRDRDVEPAGESELTRREIDTLRLMGRGLSNKEIAQELHLSVATVKNHVHAVLQKLDLSSRTEARQVVHDRPWLIRSA